MYYHKCSRFPSKRLTVKKFENFQKSKNINYIDIDWVGLENFRLNDICFSRQVKSNFQGNKRKIVQKFFFQISVASVKLKLVNAVKVCKT